ncbi:MAG: Uma2 family endonuclease [Gemmatimonadaceae bacterium]
MAMAVSVSRYTLPDLERFPDNGNRYELLDGVLIVTPAPSNAHQVIVSRLQLPLMQAVMVPGRGQVVGPVAITLPPNTHLEPDVLRWHVPTHSVEVAIHLTEVFAGL